jgi:hypothetical protein
MTSSQFKTLLSAALILGFAVTGLGLGARWWPTLDIVNNGLPFTTATAVLLLALAAFTRGRRLMRRSKRKEALVSAPIIAPSLPISLWLGVR